MRSAWPRHDGGSIEARIKTPSSKALGATNRRRRLGKSPAASRGNFLWLIWIVAASIALVGTKEHPTHAVAAQHA